MTSTGYWADVKRSVATHVPLPVRRFVWYVTDSAYRSQYKAEMERIRRFHRSHDLAWPAIWKATGGAIAGGPFVGMKYLERPGKLNQKLLGTYEKEIVDVIEATCRKGYEKIIVVGAADGYYACGLVWRSRTSMLVAFESELSCHDDITQLAELNGCNDRIQLRGFCDSDALSQELGHDGSRLVICDIDGGEVTLLDPEKVSALRNCDLLVEVHDRIAPGTTETLTRRFTPSHHVRFIAQQERLIGDLPAPIPLDSSLALAAMDEFRGSGNDWLWLQVRRD